MKKPEILLFVFISILVILGSLLFNLSGDTNGTLSSNDVAIKNLRVCSSIKNNTTQTVGLCGLLETERNSIPLIFYIFKMPEKTLVAENPVSDKFAAGDFYREFTLLNYDKDAKYEVVVYLYRNIITQMDLNIESP